MTSENPPNPASGNVLENARREKLRAIAELGVDPWGTRFDDRLLIDNLSVSIPRGAIVGIIGGNGAGKSTFFNLLTGTEQPDAGTVELGDTVSGSFDHHFSREEIEAELKAAGFRTVHTADTPYGHAVGLAG